MSLPLGPLVESAGGPEKVGALLCVTMKSSVPRGPGTDYWLMKMCQCIISPSTFQKRERFLVLGLILPPDPGLLPVSF